MAILKGLSFPLNFSSRGSFSTTSGMDKIKENIRALVLTSVGERVMNPNIGTMGKSHVFRNIDAQRLSLMKHHIKTGIELGDRRGVVLDLQLSQTDQDGKVLVDVSFKIDTSNEYENLVFYI